MMTRHAKKHLAAQTEAFGAPSPDLSETTRIAMAKAAGARASPAANLSIGHNGGPPLEPLPASDPPRPQAQETVGPPVAVKTMSVPACGRLYFGLGRNASYAAAARGDIPVIKVGRLLRAVPSVLDRRLAAAGRSPAAE